MQIVPEAEAELGYVDSIFGRGTWTRVGDGVFKYVIENCTVRVEFGYCEIAHLDKLRPIKAKNCSPTFPLQVGRE